MTAVQTIHAAFVGHIAAALDALEQAGTLPGGLNRSAVTVEPPRDPSHGDLATNAAMVLAKPAGMNPRALAEALVAELVKVPGVTSAEIAGPGFINLRVDASAWIAELRAIAALASDPPPAKLTFYTLPTGATSGVTSSLPRLSDLLRLNDAGLKTLLEGWLEGCFTRHGLVQDGITMGAWSRPGHHQPRA